ncbi:MAG: tRNA (N(6)-L-threonylcarbamoyladenosine(37)-C(2))-methylthiotransferase MtaB [Deltaproteobacteria bacterium]|nr:tRNA (N(6)-L-threonylcarbamoyladenosine(37)-C(2))-methylthiotransferase MtaB [Deltaproteobacteria bacterium]
MTAKSASITTLGCKSNQYDSSALEDILRNGNIEVVPFPSFADAYIINTCTVTGKTDYQSRQLIRKVRKINPDAVVIVTGCYAQVSPDEVRLIEGVDYILGNPEKGKVLECITRGRQTEAQAFVGSGEQGTPFTLRAKSSGGRTRANFKVQEGCNRQCSYCIIPKARGASKSLSLEEVEREIDSLVESGYKEIILTGIHLGAYGADLGEKSITSILKLIEKKAYPCRFRISSLDPDEVTEELIDILKDAKRVCNHLHLPLQSGDNNIIRKMKRPYTRELFAERVLGLFKSVPEISVGVDVIAGFPGEGEAEFENTFSLLEELPVSYLHIFPFSKRKGTPAADYLNQVNGNIIKARCEKLKELDIVKRCEFHRHFTGKTAGVLVESSRDKKSGLLKGRARNYIQVFLEGSNELRNMLVDVRLSSFDENGMTGEAIGEPLI